MTKEEMKKRILEKIESGEISQKSSTYFVLKGLLYALGIAIGFLAVMFLASFIIFSLREPGILFLSDFGFRGLFPLMLSIPWILVGVVILFILALELLARHFSFVYRKPLVYSILGILVATVFAGGAIAATPLHKKMYDRAVEKGIPLGGSGLYKRYGNPELRGGYIGVVESINENGFTIETPRNKTFFISTTTNTKYPKDSVFEEGSLVVVVGKKVDDSFEAYGIRTVTQEEIPHVLKKRMGPGPRFDEKPPKVPRMFQNKHFDEPIDIAQ